MCSIVLGVNRSSGPLERIVRRGARHRFPRHRGPTRLLCRLVAVRITLVVVVAVGAGIFAAVTYGRTRTKTKHARPTPTRS